jgi:hypothetical protein
MRSCICVYDPAQGYERRVYAQARRTLVCRIASSSSATQPRAWSADRDFGGASEIFVKTSVDTSALRSEGAPKCAMARREQDVGKRSRLSKTWKHAQRFFSPFSGSPASGSALSSARVQWWILSVTQDSTPRTHEANVIPRLAVIA